MLAFVASTKLLKKRKGTRNMNTEPTIRKSTRELALLIAANVRIADLLPEVEAFYLANKGKIVEAIRRGFIIPEVEAIALPLVFQTADTDLDWWLDQADEFARVHLRVIVSFRKMFVIPAKLPWPSAIPVFDLGTLTNRDVLRSLEKLGLNLWEERDVMAYSGSKANGVPSLHLIANSIKPDADTLTNPGQSPDDLLRTGKPYLGLRGYGLASGLFFSVKKEHLDVNTWTWFPKDRSGDGNVARGDWHPDNGPLRFRCGRPGYRDSNSGARAVVSCPLRTF